MTPDTSLLLEAVKSAPAIGAVVAVGYFIFRAYQLLVERLIVVIEGSTKAITANTEVMHRLSELIDSTPSRVVREISLEQRRLGRSSQ